MKISLLENNSELEFDGDIGKNIPLTVPVHTLRNWLLVISIRPEKNCLSQETWFCVVGR